MGINVSIKLKKLLFKYYGKFCRAFCPLYVKLKFYEVSNDTLKQDLENVYDLLKEYKKENGSNTHIERAMRIVEEALGEEVLN